MSITESHHYATVQEYLNLLLDSGLTQPAAVERTLDFAAALSHHADLSEGHIFAARIVHHAVTHLNDKPASAEKPVFYVAEGAAKTE
jgi:hypothetical protein